MFCHFFFCGICFAHVVTHLVTGKGATHHVFPCRSSGDTSSNCKSQDEDFALLQTSGASLHRKVRIGQDEAARQTNSFVNRPAADQMQTDAAGILPADLWAIHDILLLGHYGVMLKGPHMGLNATHALTVAQSAAETLAGMLPVIHPVPECRAALSAIPSHKLEAVAEASWTCLGLSASNFTSPFMSLQTPYDKSLSAAFCAPKFPLGACNGSGWPRACSFWASLHSMAVRADLHGKGQEFFNAVLQVLSGGPLYCVGCTRHVRLLGEPLLPNALLDAESFLGV
mmetsp:Transcript_31510/g.57258  ORF Transcript_31510/g.57258 Transcript_31510/m.57258 type:complete len:284 (+) Transcript_31510:150-1001(+)